MQTVNDILSLSPLARSHNSMITRGVYAKIHAIAQEIEHNSYRFLNHFEDDGTMSLENETRLERHFERALYVMELSDAIGAAINS